MTRARLLLPLLFVPLLSAVAAEDPAAAPPPLADVIRIFDAAATEELDLDALVARLADAEVVFFGETHLDETTHRLEAELFRRLVEAREGAVVLAMEMFERDVQPVVDAYLAGEIAEEEFTTKARAWHNYRTGYRAMVETAKEHGVPVVASNAPASLRMRVGFGGREALDALPAEQRAWLPAELLPNSDFYWDRFARVVRGHMAMIAGDDPERRLTSGQSLWDNTMGESCAQALARWPDRLVFHVNGGFHSQYREGAVAQLLARRPDTRVTVIDAVPVNDLPGMGEWYDERRADVLIACDARARGAHEGFFGVRLAPDLRYRLHLPPTAAPDRPVPLLVWLHDGGLRAADGLARWVEVLGDEAAIAAIEGPYPQIEEDLATGARWFWGETFREDVGTVEGAVADVRDYVVRNFAIDPARVVVAGEGTGGTVVAACALYQRGLAADPLAIDPRRYSELRSLALPGPFPDDVETLRLTVLVAPSDEEWWRAEAEDHARARLDTAVEVEADAWRRSLRTEALLRERLGLPERPQAAEGAPGLLLVLPDGSRRGRAWAERYARHRMGADRRVALVAPHEVAGFLAEVDPARWEVETLRLASEPDPLAGSGVEARAPVGPDALAHSRVIPRASGSFGGTTVLLVPAGADRAAWDALEENDPLAHTSRFHRLRVVYEDDAEDSLEAALEEAQQAGRSSILVVPAVFAADGDAMRRWAKAAAPWADALTIEWLPGLGGRLRHLAPPPE